MSLFVHAAAHAQPLPQGESAPEEMLVVGERRAAMDVLAGATTTRIETDARLLEGAGLDDLLSEIPGVQVRRFGGAGETFEVSIRGSRPQQVPIFLDGVRLDSALTSQTDLSVVCLDVLDEIQVTRGAGAGRAGSGAIGGVVNLVSRRPTAKPETRLRLAVGHFGTIAGSVRHARRIGDWGVSLAYCGLHTEGDYKFQRARNDVGGGSSRIDERINNQADRHSGLVQIERIFGESTLRLTHLASHIDRGTPGSDDDQRARANERNLLMLSILRLETPTEFGPSGDLTATLAHQFERNDFEDPEVQFARDPIDTETVVQTLTPRLEWKTGFDAFGGRFDGGLLAEGRLDTRSSDEATTRSRLGASLRAEITSHWLDDRLRVSPSLRFDRFEGLDAKWLPGVFVEADPMAWIRLKGSAARSFRVPSFGELYLPDKGFQRGNENLAAEIAWNYEVGIRISSPFEADWLRGEIEATWFTGRIDNSIVFQQISPLVSSYVNTGKVETKGHELSIRWRPHDWVRVTASRTVTDSKLKASGAKVSGIARSQVNARLELGPRNFVKVVGEFQYSGRIVVNSDTRTIPSRSVFDASAAIDLAQIEALGVGAHLESLWLSLRGRNLTNTAVRDAQFYPRPGRNLTIALEGVF